MSLSAGGLLYSDFALRLCRDTAMATSGVGAPQGEVLLPAAYAMLYGWTGGRPNSIEESTESFLIRSGGDICWILAGDLEYLGWHDGHG